MAIDKKISELSNGAPAQASDEYVVARGAANYKLTLTNLAASMPPIGATTPNTGAFTTLSATGNVGFDGGTFTFNESGADKDFRVEGDTDANLIFSDASTDRVGIGTSTPATKLDVNGTITATAVNTTTLDLTNLEVTNIKAKDGTAAMSIADSSGIVSVTANPVLSAGTANGVLYLNGSKVATSGSALTFDGSGLGINMIASEGGVTPALFAKQNSNGAFEGLVVRSSAAGGEILAISYDGSVFNHTASYVGSGGYVPLAWTVSGSEAMRLTSTGLGIGTSSPVGKLDVVGSSSRVRWDLSNAYVYQAATNTAASAFAAAYYDGSQHLWLTSSSTRMTLDASGNLGLGVTPSAWKSTNPAFQIGQSGSVFSYSSTNIVGLGANFFINSAGDEKYITTNTAGFYRIFGNVHTWWNAPSGTAGNTITFTQAMTLDAAGRLLLGVTSGAGNATLDLVANSGAGAINIRGRSSDNASSVYFYSNDNATLYSYISQNAATDFQLRAYANIPMVFYTNNAERARITSGGGFQCVNALSVGNATPTTSGAGVTFPATQSASSDANTLDDYEEGTWTPSLGGTATYTTQRGKYTKIGRAVYVTGIIVVNLIGTGSTTVISGLPFTTTSQDSGGIQITYLAGGATNVVFVTGYANDGDTKFTFYSLTAAAATTGTNAIFGNGTQVNFSGMYFV